MVCFNAKLYLTPMDRVKQVVFVFLLVAPLPAQTLRSLADARNVHFGTAVAPAHLGEEDYATLLAREFNQVEPENAMKFGPIHPSRDTYNFGPADELVKFAQAHKMAVRGHTLVWHNQVANWVRDGNFSADQIAAISREHIRTVLGHYAGQVYAWDVVNEAFENDGSLRKTLWSRDGTGYIEQALRWAHAADPAALLFYNDFGAEGMNAKSDAIYKMAKDFKTRGVPLDGIGWQMHIGLKPPATTALKANLDRITALGLQVQITELDVKLPVDASGVATAGAIEAQAAVYRDIVGVCLANPHCTAIQTWGFTDKYSWIPRANRGFGAALEFDGHYQPKPAYRAIVEAFQHAR